MNKEKLGSVITLRREALFLNQEDLADMAGVSIRTIYMIESGKGNPSFNTLEQIMKVLGLEISIGIKQVL